MTRTKELSTGYTVDVFRSYLERMQRTLEAYCTSADPRRVFQQTYVTFSERVLEALERKRFVDSEWATDMCCRFVDLYFERQEAYDAGIPEQCEVWRNSFDLTRSSQVNVLQAMLLGMNAHINYDLTLCTYGTARRFGELEGNGHRLDSKRYYDFLVINDVAWESIDVVQHAVLRRFAPWLDLGNRLSLNFTKSWGERILCAHRDKAWARARLLMRTSNAEEFDTIRRLIDAVACRNIELISVLSLNPIRAYRRFCRWRAQNRHPVSSEAAALLQEMYLNAPSVDDLVLETLIDTNGDLRLLIERCLESRQPLKARRVFALAGRRGDAAQMASLAVFLHAPDRNVRLAAASLAERYRTWLPSAIDRKKLEKQIRCDVDDAARLTGMARRLQRVNLAVELQGALLDEVRGIEAHVHNLRAILAGVTEEGAPGNRADIGNVTEDEIRNLMDHSNRWLRLCALLAAGQLGCFGLRPALQAVAVNGGEAERETADFVLGMYFSEPASAPAIRKVSAT